jgi:hypothetical protein
MTRPARFLAARRFRMSDDSGVSLIFALIFITVIAVITGAVLTLIDANLRTTVAMRSQATEAAEADGAVQIAINTLRNGTYLGADANCFGVGPTASANLDVKAPFYSTVPAAAAVVTCELDTTNTNLAPINSANRPAVSLLSLGTLADPDDGINLNIRGGGGSKDIIVTGGVFSNSELKIPHGELMSTWATSRGVCDSGAITVSPGPKRCGIGSVADTAGEDPNYAAPPAASAGTDRTTLNTCDSSKPKLVEFFEGRYTSAAVLNTSTQCDNNVYWFHPGVYYFNFDGVWNVAHGTVIGGNTTTGTAPDPKKPPTLPNACKSPVSGSEFAATEGVQFVFGKKSQINFTGTAQVELCGRYSGTTAPVVLYGLKTGLGGSLPVDAHADCATALASCTVVTSTDGSHDDYEVYLQGTTYLPKTAMDLHLKKELQIFFKGGVVAHHLKFDGPGNTVVATPMISTPGFSSSPNRTVVWLNVYVCPGGGTCDAGTGKLRLRVKVSIVDSPSGEVDTGTRQVTVLNWSVQR